MLKRFKFACTGRWISHIHRPCRCPGRRHLQLTCRFWSNGRVKFTGKARQLKKSAAYPNALGKAIVNAWRKNTAYTTQSSTSSPGWLEMCPGPKKSLPGKCWNTEHKADAKKMRKPSSASHSSPPWWQPSPGCACASSAEPSWLQPQACGVSKPSLSATRSDSHAPVWLNPAANSC